MADGRRLRTLEGHGDSVNSVALSGDGRLALSGGRDETVRLWDLTTGRCLRTLEGHTDSVSSVALGGDERNALSGSRDRTARLWDLAAGRCVRTLTGHTDSVSSVALSRDGRFALSGSADKTVRLWNLSDGRCLRTFEGHKGSVTSVALSGDGRLALSGSEDTTVRVWLLDWELDDRAPADWNERARPYLVSFLSAHTPYAASLPQGREPNAEEITLALTRRGKPLVGKENFEQLLFQLGCAGFGWLQPEGVRREMERMIAAWKGPPPLPER